MYVDPDGYESVSTTLEKAEHNADSALGAFGYRFLSNLYHFGTLGFASVHDPQRDAYDEGKISGREYALRGVGGGAAIVAANIVTGRAAGAAIAGKGLATQTAIASGSGALIGAGNDAATQVSRISADQQEEYNVGQTLTATAFGGVLGGAYPGAAVLTQKISNALSKTKIGNFFSREANSGAVGTNGANQGALKGKSESVTRQGDSTAAEVAQSSSGSNKTLAGTDNGGGFPLDYFNRLPRKTNLPLLNQLDNSINPAISCGPTCGSLALNKNGITKVTPDDLSVLLKKDFSDKGVTPSALARAMRQSGGNATALPVTNIKRGVDVLARQTSNGNPAIVRVKTSTGRHFIVVDKVLKLKNNRELVIIRNPTGPSKGGTSSKQSYALERAHFEEIFDQSVITTKSRR